MKKALVLGGYGLIGSACMRALCKSGFQVTGMGRSASGAARMNSFQDWIIADIATARENEWREILQKFDVVVNASGALQDGSKDNLQAIHVDTVERIIGALSGTRTRLIHLSAAGVSLDAPTRFFRTKAQGDMIISKSSADWIILRPTLVISPQAYGGTALLRAAASLPLVQIDFWKHSNIQTIYVEDVANAVAQSAIGEIPTSTIADLTEEEVRNFPELISSFRGWLGWPQPAFKMVNPTFVIEVLAKFADVLGYLGWRSPLRSTAVKTIKEGIKGDPTIWIEAGGKPNRSLDQTLSILPATYQERLFARVFLALPIAVATLSVFWITSGLIGTLKAADAMAVLTNRNVSESFAQFAVIGGSIADIALGIGILLRPWVKLAALGMIILSLGYLLGGTVAAPDLWTDPLGPMVKVLPSIMLAALVWLMLEDR